MRAAQYYETIEQGLKCKLCPKGCIIGEGKSGFCRVRKNVGGILYTESYGACTSLALDPIEKKPLYHFYPGSSIFSVGSWGCNFACRFCQNWQIAQRKPDWVEVSPEELVGKAGALKFDNIGIAYTYSEPSVWFEFVLDCARLARDRGLKNVLVTNGFINREPLAELLPFIDAMNIDVKAFNNDFYRTVCSGQLDDVKRTVELAAARCHVEVTTLVVPGLNDSPDEIEALAVWLARVNRDIPLHLSRYFPNYEMDLSPTPLSTLRTAHEIVSKHLNYVYLGNVGDDKVNTLCPQCGFTVINRVKMQACLQDGNKCPRCGNHIAIVGQICF